MIQEINDAFDHYEAEIEKIIKQEVPLRDPSIAVVHVTVPNMEQSYKKFVLMLKKLKDKHPAWIYKTINIEKIFYDILKEGRYIDQQQFVLTCDRKEFDDDLKNSITSDLIQQIENEIHALKECATSENPPPFLVLINMHATYPHIKTGDVIARIINEKGVYIIILYLDTGKHDIDGDEAYKKDNYTVYSDHLI